MISQRSAWRRVVTEVTTRPQDELVAQASVAARAHLLLMDEEETSRSHTRPLQRENTFCGGT